MTKYQAYPEYKDSGVEWLADIPVNWYTEKTKRMFYLKRNLVGNLSNSYQLLSLTLNGVVPRDISSGEGKIPASFDTYQSVQADDLIFCLFDMDETPRTVGIAKQDGMITGAYNVYACMEKCLPKFAYYYFLHVDSFKGLKPYYTGLRKVVRADTFGCIEIPFPPIAEQKNICLFLEYETAKIDNLIEKQQQLIELLKEKRQAMISHAVTKGLNPDVPMKDSGVEWLGEVPEHWGVTRLKYECSHIVDCPHSTPNYADDGDYPAIRTADIFSGYLDLAKCRRVTKGVYDERNTRLIPRAGDIIYSREGERFGIGAAIPEGAKVCLAQRVMLFRAKSTPGYLMWALNSSSTYNQAQQDCIGSTSPHVNVDTIKNFNLAWPPESERVEISNFIHQISSSVESLVTLVTKKLKLLQERRTALISAAVTGKIDVRNWVAPEAREAEVSQEATA